MNCANHPDRAIAKYCRTCGKPLCNDCVREVMGIAYCENCLAERVAASGPSSPYTAPAAPMVVQSSGPSPGLAGILGAIQFGVGAVYNGQYAKGLAHLVIFILLVIGASHGREPLDTICGIGIAAFVFYQIIDAVNTAKAINAGQTPPDPLGVGTMFSPGGEKRDITRGAPAGAVILILLGLLFLLQNTEIWFLSFGTLWPLLLIALGGWLFLKKKAAVERGYWAHRSLVGPAILVTFGVVVLLNNLHDRWEGVPGLWRTWPVVLLVVGILKLMERGHFANNPYFTQPPPPPGVPPEQQPPSGVNSEVKNG